MSPDSSLTREVLEAHAALTDHAHSFAPVRDPGRPAPNRLACRCRAEIHDGNVWRPLADQWAVELIADDYARNWAPHLVSGRATVALEPGHHMYLSLPLALVHANTSEAARSAFKAGISPVPPGTVSIACAVIPPRRSEDAEPHPFEVVGLIELATPEERRQRFTVIDGERK